MTSTTRNIPLKEHNLPTAMRRSRGVSLIELLLSVGVIAIILAAATSIFGSVQQAAKVQTSANDLLALQTGVRKGFPFGNYSELTISNLIDGEMTPQIFLNQAGTALIGPWSTSMGVLPRSVGGGTNNAFLLNFGNVPTSACTELINQIQGAFALIQVSASSGTAGTAVKNTFSDPAIALSPTTLTGACDRSRNWIRLTSE